MRDWRVGMHTVPIFHLDGVAPVRDQRNGMGVESGVER
jgi:hypothetical protein